MPVCLSKIYAPAKLLCAIFASSGIIKQNLCYGVTLMDEAKVLRINELWAKSQAEGLTGEEKEEQQALRQEYIDSYKRNLRGQLEDVRLVDEHGEQPLKKKDGH